MQNKIVNTARAVIAVMVIVWMGALPALAQDCEEWANKFDNFGEYWREITPEQVKICLENGANATARNAVGYTPLHLAAGLSENPKVISELLNAGANVNARDRDGNTPLHWATRRSNSPEVIMTLLEADANKRALNNSRETPAYFLEENVFFKNTDAYWTLKDALY